MLALPPRLEPLEPTILHVSFTALSQVLSWFLRPHMDPRPRIFRPIEDLSPSLRVFARVRQQET